MVIEVIMFSQPERKAPDRLLLNWNQRYPFNGADRIVLSFNFVGSETKSTAAK